MRRSAFTLVELIVVITIMAILAALILAGVQTVRRNGDSAHSASNIHALAQANIAYHAEHGRYAPADDKRNNRRWHGARRSAGEPFDPEKGFLSPYLGEARRITACPVFREMMKGSDSFEEGTGGYGYNGAYIGGTPAWGWNRDGTRVSAVAGAIDRPAGTVMFTSSAYAREGGVQEYPYCEPPFWDFGDGASDARPSPTVHFRFNGKALVAWCDGHVTYEKPAPRGEGDNPHGGDAPREDLGWFGPEKENGFWNPNRSYANEPR